MGWSIGGVNVASAVDILSKASPRMNTAPSTAEREALQKLVDEAGYKPDVFDKSFVKPWWKFWSHNK
ncbi:MAG: hypothetical protein ABUL56_00710 [Actinomycetota bacterium]